MPKQTEIVLGTANFGSPYGYRQNQNHVGVKDINRLLVAARNLGIRTIDTAFSYPFHPSNLHKILNELDMKLWTKSKLQESNPEEREDYLSEDFLHLRRFSRQVTHHLVHNWSSVNRGAQNYSALKTFLSELGSVRLGVSTYGVRDARNALRHKDFDLIQLEFNMVNQANRPLLEKKLDKKKQIAARSIFLQGLLLENPLTLPGKFEFIKDYLFQLRGLCASYNLTPLDVSLRYVLGFEAVDFIVVGVVNVEQLTQIVESFQKGSLPNDLLGEIENLKRPSSGLADPRKWSM